MSGVLLVRDPDLKRRRATVERGRARLAAAGLAVLGELERGDVAAVWGVPATAPLDRATGPGWDAFLLGDVLDEHGARVTAADYGARWGDGATPAPHDGYHLALVVGDDGSVTVDADLLGFFPVVHTTVDGALLVASGTGLLAAHPSFRPVLDPAALAAVLLADAPMADTTVLRGVRRLPPGHVLRAEPGAAPTTVRTFAVEVGDGLHDVPVGAAADRLDEALADAVRRHCADPGRVGLLLSGGLDSRLLAGALLREGVPARALTFGEPTDSEWRFAARVARRIGIPHERVPDDGRGAHFRTWLGRDALTATPFLEDLHLGDRFERVVSGFAMDATIGGSHISWCFDEERGEVGIDAFLRRVNRAGVAAADLERLLRPDVFPGGVDDALDAVADDYRRGGDGDLARAWAFDLAHRQRFWVGARVPRLSFAAWPVLPHVDRRVLETTAAVPLALLADRQVEEALCRRRFPDLARIPLDTAHTDAGMLVPRTADMVEQALRRKGRAVRERAGLPTRETRYFTRIFDIRGEHWQAVRADAERGREAAHALFVPEVLDQLVPPASEPWTRPSAYYESNGAKMLLAVMTMLADEVAAP